MPLLCDCDPKDEHCPCKDCCEGFRNTALEKRDIQKQYINKIRAKLIERQLRKMIKPLMVQHECDYCGEVKQGVVKLPNKLRRCIECDPDYVPPTEVVLTAPGVEDQKLGEIRE